MLKKIRKNIRRLFKKETEPFLGYKYFCKASFPLTPSGSGTSTLEKGSLNKFVWQMWWQGENEAPLITKNCMDSVKRFLPKDYKYVLITKDNISDYLTIPSFIQEKLNKGISFTHFSDYVRASLLHKFGGIWIDSTCFLSSPIPDEILHSELFYFQSETFYLNSKLPSENLLDLHLKTPLLKATYHTGSSWFIVAKANNHLLSVTKSLLEHYWQIESKLVDYFLFHCAITYAVLHDEKCGDIFLSMPKYSNIPPHLLQFSISKKNEISSEVLNNCFIHKLTYKKDYPESLVNQLFN